MQNCIGYVGLFVCTEEVSPLGLGETVFTYVIMWMLYETKNALVSREEKVLFWAMWLLTLKSDAIPVPDNSGCGSGIPYDTLQCQGLPRPSFHNSLYQFTSTRPVAQGSHTDAHWGHWWVRKEWQNVSVKEVSQNMIILSFFPNLSRSLTHSLICYPKTPMSFS